MKLYNIFKSVILEEKKQLLTENVREEIIKAIDSRYNVWFKYRDDENTVTDRYVQIYDLGMSANGNEMISAYQLGGNIKPSKKGNKAYGWKQFIINKIVDGSIKPVNITYKQPVSDLPSYGAGPKFNSSGNKNMRGNITKVNFNEK